MLLRRLLAVLLLLLVVSSLRAEDPVVPKDGPIKLFNGQNLEGFYTWMKDTQYEDPKQVFRVTDGMLHVTGEGLGGLLTKASYANYHCVLEFRLGEKTWEPRTTKTKDSGLLIHSTGKDGGYGGTWMPSLEVQIIEGGMGDFILVTGDGTDGKPVPLSITCETDRDRDGEVIWKPDGKRETFDNANRKRVNWFGRDPDWKDEIGFRGKQDVDKPGEWTRFDVICDGGHVAVYVNGVKVNEAFEVNPAAGRLQLQTELAEIFVRKWELWPLSPEPRHIATIPVPRPDAGWTKRHESFNAIAKSGEPELVFLGDSITQGWEGAGKDVWAKRYAPRNAANFGIGGDRTEHVLYRLQHGNLEGLKPKLIVLMIGTNNTGHQGRNMYVSPPEKTADGVAAIVNTLKTRLPEAKILLLGIFPRGATPEDPFRKQNVATNEIIAKLADGERVKYLDIGSAFLADDGTLPKEIMPDLLHLSPAGYEKWAEAIEPTLKGMLGE